MNGITKKIAYCGVSAAIATVCIILTNVLPLKVSLLMFAAVCYYIAFNKSGIVFGFLSIAASMLIGFFSFGISGGFVLTGVVFAPYAVLAFFIKKLYHTKTVTLLIRIFIMAVFANLALVAVYFLGKFTGIDFTLLLSYLGGYYVWLALIVTVLFIIFDFLYYQLCMRLCKLIK